MASDGPDPQSLKSWHDAFQYPIPTVRRVEQELRRDIASNKEKLRSLVGTRYRELVGTAEMIVSMNREMQDVDTTLGDIGRRCNPRLMEKKYTHYNQIKGDVEEKDAEKRTLGAQLALLHRCTTSISRLLRRRGSLLLVAKLIVVSRLLYNTLSKQTTVPPFVESLRKQLASLRNALLGRIDKRLSASASTADDIIEALAAHCLASSASSDGAIQHFHKLRLGVIETKLKASDTTGENVLNALRLYIRTLQSTKILLSRRLSDVLSKLKLRPLLADPDVRSLDDLGLDVLGRWVAADVSNFTPWIKLSEVSKPEADKAIKQWSRQAFDKFVEGCQTSLGSWVDFSELLSLRQKTIELWLCSWSSTPTHSPLQVLEGLRTTFNGKLTQILSDESKSLDCFGLDVASAVSRWDKRDHSAGRSLWDHELMSLDYSNGAGAFKQAIVDSLLGRDEDTSAALKKYSAWLSTIEKFRVDIDELRRIRWTDVLEGEDEDSDVDIPATLNEDDTRLLGDALQSAVNMACQSLQTSFKEIFDTFRESGQSGQAAFMLKVIRLVRRDLPTAFVGEDFVFSKDIVPQLQKLLATEVTTHIATTRFLIKVDVAGQRVPGRTLWEGDPELPVQPSPATFKFLRHLVGQIDNYGPGLWDVSTVRALKESLQDEVARSASAAMESTKSLNPAEDKNSSFEKTTSEDTADGTPDSADTPTTAQILKDRKFQLYFDAVYLKNALAVKDVKHGALDRAVEQVAGGLDSDESCTTIVERRAREYWTRTQLLFGLLSE
ncbi:hypothetical protein ATEIFO6365_0014002300 [Aspergillus terreus]|uniref:Conserved oligomeric Golgi complex subunit 1 n=1 Tax=Aspergillus terreus TaxID=33178 RepID=A0A5M3Z2J5_ASPTE|nr:hypothetical protein ATETN484_0008019000 [Aspergillus terreus]GFF21091.1 hypothetical protein ATEIFO6365_0014002300 [Aspergillus terreus]